jgi:hypothetical protein
MFYIAALIAGFFRLCITSVKTFPDPVTGIEQAGALVPNGGMVGALAALQTNASPAFGNWSQTLVPASLTARTYTGAELVGGIIKRFSPGAAFTDCTDTATNIINSIPGAKVNQSFPLLIGNLGSGVQTIGAGTGVTITGSATIASNCVALFLATVTGSTAVSLTRCFQFAGNPAVSAL